MNLKPSRKSSFVFLSLVFGPLVFIGCGSSDSKETVKVSSNDNKGTAETENKPEPPKTAKQKLPGKWSGTVSFSNERFDSARESLSDESKRDALDSLIEDMMGTPAKLELNDDGSFSAEVPIKGSIEKIAGNWSISEDKNDSAVLDLAIKQGDQESRVSTQLNFVKDDRVQIAYEPYENETTKEIFFLDLHRANK